jgi:hypothetical protein
LFNDALKNSDFTAFNDSCTVNDEMWKEAVVIDFKVLPWHFAEGTKKNRDNIVKVHRLSHLDLNLGLPEYDACVLLNRPRPTVT